MLVNSYGFQSYSNTKNQASFGQKQSTIKDLEATVKELTERLNKHLYNMTLQAKLKQAKEALEKLLTGNK